MFCEGEDMDISKLTTKVKTREMLAVGYEHKVP
jgi:hypothetical protein